MNAPKYRMNYPFPLLYQYLEHKRRHNYCKSEARDKKGSHKNWNIDVIYHTFPPLILGRTFAKSLSECFLFSSGFAKCILLTCGLEIRRLRRQGSSKVYFPLRLAEQQENFPLPIHLNFFSVSHFTTPLISILVQIDDKVSSFSLLGSRTGDDKTKLSWIFHAVLNANGSKKWGFMRGYNLCKAK